MYFNSQNVPFEVKTANGDSSLFNLLGTNQMVTVPGPNLNLNTHNTLLRYQIQVKVNLPAEGGKYYQWLCMNLPRASLVLCERDGSGKRKSPFRVHGFGFCLELNIRWDFFFVVTSLHRNETMISVRFQLHSK